MARRPPLRYDGDLRAVLLAAAEAEVAERGSAAVSLRAIARRAGVSHAAPAYHFQDKAGVLTALATEGFRRLTESMRAAIADSAARTPAREVEAAGMGYLRFALAHRALFDVMWRPSSLHGDDQLLREHGDAAFQVLVGAIAAAQDRGWGAEHDGALLSLLAWSWVHGFAVLWLDGPLGDQGDDDAAEDMARAMGRILVRALDPDPARPGPP